MWVSVEGVNGVGKTYLLGRAADMLPGRLVSELTDSPASALPGRIVAAMAGGTFLRTGHPITETLALLAMKTWEYETARAAWSDLVLEDRGIDTVAVYQAIILDSPVDPHELADQILRTAARFRPLPDRTILLTDDFETCVRRYEQRCGSAVPDADRVLMSRVAEFYLERAAREPDRFIVIDRRGASDGDVLDRLCRACASEDAA